jgi:hypothetical protein
MWENAFLLSLQCGDFSFAITAINRLLDLRRAEVKFTWIKTLVSYVIKATANQAERTRAIGRKSLRRSPIGIDILLVRLPDCSSGAVTEPYF